MQPGILFDDSKIGPYNKHTFKFVKNAYEVLHSPTKSIDYSNHDSNYQSHTDLANTICDETEPTLYINQGDQYKPTQKSSCIGLSAIKSFNEKYKAFNKGSSEFRASSKTALYLKEIASNFHTPRPMGLVKLNGLSTSIDIDQYKAGDSYAPALSQSIKQLKPLVLNISDNRLTNKGLSTIVKSLSHTICDLDLSKNKIGKDAVESLCGYFNSKAEKYII